MNKEALRKMFEELEEMKRACDKLAHQKHCYVMGLDCKVAISDDQERLAHWAINLLCRENQI